MENKKTVSISVNTVYFICYILLVSCIGYFMATALPVHARPSYKTDDGLLMAMAADILRGKWLGDYSPVILMKGCFYPLLCAVFTKMGIPYLSGFSLMNIGGCIYLAGSLRPLLKTRAKTAALFTVLMFDPVLTAELTYQRLYRNSLTAAQVMFVFGAWFYMYFRKDIRERFLHALFGGFMLWGFWNTREDCVFILPFVVTASAVIIVKQIRAPEFKKTSLQGRAAAVLCLTLPFIMLLTGNHIIRVINEIEYGLPRRLEFTEGSFPEALRAIYAVQDPDPHDLVSVSTRKLEILYELSPSLNSIRDNLEAHRSGYFGKGYGLYPDQAGDAFFHWALRRGAFDAGAADTSEKAEAFYAAVAEEINAAIESGIVGTNPVMPSPLMSPWRQEYSRKIIRALDRELHYLVRMKGVVPSSVPFSHGSFKEVRGFIAYSNNLAGYNENNLLDDQGFQTYKETFVKRIVFLDNIYHRLNPIVFFLSIAVLAGFLAVHAFRKSFRPEDASFVLLLASVVLTLTVLMGGIAYVEISAFPTIMYYYMNGAYPLLLTAEWMIILYCAGSFRKGTAPAETGTEVSAQPDSRDGKEELK